METSLVILFNLKLAVYGWKVYHIILTNKVKTGSFFQKKPRMLDQILETLQMIGA